MKILQSLQHNFAILGIDEYQSKQKHSFNVRSVSVLLIFGISLISGCVSIAHANTFKEYLNAFHIAVTVAFGGLTFIIVICQMKILFPFIDYVEKVIDESKRKSSTSSIKSFVMKLILC